MSENVSAAREAATRVVETYLNCVVSGDFESIPLAFGYGSESPSSGRIHGEAAVAYLKLIGAEMNEIRIVRHVVEGNFVATQFEEVLGDATLPVFALFELDADRVKFVRVFFDSAS